jgi:hypothetical protein
MALKSKALRDMAVGQAGGCAAKVLVLRRLALVEVLRQFGGSSAAILQPQDVALDHKSGLGEVAGELKPSPDKGFIEIGLIFWVKEVPATNAPKAGPSPFFG